jgi:DNA invertase Pin-like site-specific DNA recombinase
MKLCPHCGKPRQNFKALHAHIERDHAGELLPAPGVPPRPDEPAIRCYVRVSTDDQDNENQRIRIKAAAAMRGWTNIVWYEDKMSGAKNNRPGLVRLQLDLQRGDIVVILRADRLSRSLRDFVLVTEYIHDVGAELLCVEQPIDTTSPMGRAFWQMLGVFAELERALIIQRTNDGMAKAKAAGRPLGRHRNGCGYAFPCPTGTHGPDTMPTRPPGATRWETRHARVAALRERFTVEGVTAENDNEEARPLSEGKGSTELGA